jgi:hypothetical protein
MTKSGIMFSPECPESFKTINPTFLPFFFSYFPLTDSYKEPSSFSLASVSVSLTRTILEIFPPNPLAGRSLVQL